MSCPPTVWLLYYTWWTVIVWLSHRCVSIIYDDFSTKWSLLFAILIDCQQKITQKKQTNHNSSWHWSCVGRKDTWTEERTFDVTYPGCTGTQGSVHISRPLSRDSQIISLPWHGTSSSAPGRLTEHGTASVSVHVAEGPRPPAISTSCRMWKLRAVLTTYFVNLLHVSEKATFMFQSRCGLCWFCYSDFLVLRTVLIQMQEAVRAT